SMVQDLSPEMMSGSSDIILQLNPVLDGGGIVLQVSDHSLREARFHRWAEPLNAQLGALVSNNLSKEKFSLKDHTLEVYVARFQGSESGNIYISASFSVLNSQGLKLKTVSRQLETQQSEPGYDALVSSLRTGFDWICHDALLELK
ncbi:MAG: membrane integrity-associated transporter subunit PqiC, partial [Succinivibrio sp.]|nr:membrane integrity-associated transporter subunit PqiC [Succinivibrio sp.]